MMAEYSDNYLYTKIKEDDKSAFEVIFLRYYSSLCTYACTILSNKDASEEVVQDLFVKIWENRKDTEITTSLKSYLYRTIHNQCINLIESWKVRDNYTKKYNSDHNPSLTTIPFSGDYPIANLIVKELEDKIDESIKTLPEQCREIFLMIRIYDKSYQEVADKLNISVNTVKTQMQRAVSKMKEMLKEYLPIILGLLTYFIKKS
jgi:RNA polymerase sigma-70 factor (ECF subfamily)